MNNSLPEQATAVVIGGGVIGASIAYHLSRIGWNDVVLLERSQFACGTSWHAAGLIGTMRANENHARLCEYSNRLLSEIEEETGQATGYRQVGSLSVAHSEDRFEELKRVAAMNNAFGITQVDIISPQEAATLAPILKTDDLIGASWVASDGHASPVDVVNAFIKGARNRGATCLEGVQITDISVSNGKVCGVKTNAGDIKADNVVIAAGLWSRQLGKLVGVDIPLYACEHYYAHTQKIDGLSADTPVIRDHDICAYIREDAGSLLVGAFEAKALPIRVADLPADFSFDELPGHAEQQLFPVLEDASQRLPVLENIEWRSFFCGPESFTPDDQFHLGPTAEFANLFVACGLNSVGIQSSGGIGKALADWMDKGHPPMDLWGNDLRRTYSFQNTTAYLESRVSETLGLLYARHYPFRQYETARQVRLSPIHHRLGEHNACFGEAAGWERPNWFAPVGEEANYQYSFGRQNWFDYSAAEHRAAREKVALFDQSSFAKYVVKGRDATEAMQRICSADVDVDPGRLVYTHWLNERGGIEADLTVQRLSEHEYLVVSGAVVARRDLDWLARNIASDSACAVVDVTAGWAVLGVMGPDSRDLLSSCSDYDFSNDNFAFGQVRDIELGCAPVRAARVSYVGELGYEIYVSSDMAQLVFDHLYDAGRNFDLTLAGMHALESCRVEKAFRHFGHDISDEDTPVEAGMSFVCAMDKPTRFIGYDAIAVQKEARPLSKRMVQFKLDDPEVILYHHEPILRNGDIVGHLSSGSYGHTVGAAIGMGYVHTGAGVCADYIKAGQWEIMVGTDPVPAQASLAALYDPSGARMRG